MERGLLVIVAVGAIFGYFALDMFRTASIDEDSQWNGAVEDKYAQYYSKDVLGDRVLDLNALPLPKAKNVWRQMPIGDEIASLLPDFDTAKTEASNLVAQGKFRDYLLKTIETLKGKFLVGDIGLDAAKKQIKELP